MKKTRTIKVVVIGGGFAGINFIKRLAKDRRFQIILVDQNNYHFFPPLLYQVASAFIEPSNISYPFRRMFQKRHNIRFHMGTFLRVNSEDKTIETDTGILSYDYLVFALGTETNYFGMDNLKRCALPMKTMDDALNLRNQLLLNMEKAVQTQDPAEKARHLNIVIAGGGATGVEVAGMLAEMGREIGAKEYPELKKLRSHLYIVNSSSVLLPPMSKKSQQEAEKVLRRLGVHVVLDKAVKDYVNGNVILADGTVIASNIVIWAIGVIGKKIMGLPPQVIGRGRRVMVDAYNQVIDVDNIYAIGDICLQTHEKDFPDGHPQLAQVAIQHGKALAKNLKRLADQKSLVPFHYRDRGSMAIIAKYKAVVDLPGFFFKGFVAWVCWLFIHIIPLIGFRNKVKLAFSWSWSFITNDPTLRLIFRAKVKQKENAEV